MIKVAVIGSTGYAGATLVSILLKIKEVEIVYLASHSYVGKSFSDVYPAFKNVCDITLQEDDILKASKISDVVFLGLPAELSSKMVTNEVLENAIIIDLGADFRLKDKEDYKTWYNFEHSNTHLLQKAVYGLCEINRKDIKNARLIANPGCYTTCSILTLYPLVKENLIDINTIVIDAKSGVSGAGRSEKIASLYAECNENLKAYGVTNHRHTPEIEEQLSLAANEKLTLQFTPHLIPMNRGILASIYAKLKIGVSQEDVKNAYEKYYKNEKYIRLVSHLPETKFVKGTNFVDISFKIDKRTNNIVCFGALDNLMKGAATQAVQNMLIAYDLENTYCLNSLSSAVI